MLTKVRRRDQDLVTEALRRLGTSESEGLLYQATIFVEGEEDVDLLELGFSELLRRHKLKDLGGRKEVEKQIALLQDAEKDGEKLTPKYFIFDRDELPTGLKSSDGVKVLQWNRRCLENYLIDIDILTDVLMNPEVVQAPFANQGEVVKQLKDLAMSQIDDFVANKIYQSYGLESPGLRSTEVQGKNLEEIADILFNRIAKIQAQILNLDRPSWRTQFVNDCAAARKELEPIWETKWREDCDGKRLFRDLHKTRQFRISLRNLKRRVMSGMRNTPPSENWRSVESHLKGLIGAKPGN